MPRTQTEQEIPSLKTDSGAANSVRLNGARRDLANDAQQSGASKEELLKTARAYINTVESEVEGRMHLNSLRSSPERNKIINRIYSLCREMRKLDDASLSKYLSDNNITIEKLKSEDSVARELGKLADVVEGHIKISDADFAGAAIFQGENEGDWLCNASLVYEQRTRNTYKSIWEDDRFLRAVAQPTNRYRGYGYQYSGLSPTVSTNADWAALSQAHFEEFQNAVYQQNSHPNAQATDCSGYISILFKKAGITLDGQFRQDSDWFESLGNNPEKARAMGFEVITDAVLDGRISPQVGDIYAYGDSGGKDGHVAQFGQKLGDRGQMVPCLWESTKTRADNGVQNTRSWQQGLSRVRQKGGVILRYVGNVVPPQAG